MVGEKRQRATDNDLVRALRERVNRLEQRRTAVPVLNNDPPAGSPVNVWLLYDGRLRARNPNTGAVQEYTPTGTPGAGTSAPQKPVPAAARQQNVGVWSATWGQTYSQAGAQVSTNGLQFGAPAFGTSFRSLFGFPVTTIRSVIGGALVQRVELLLPVLDLGIDPTIVAIGASTASTAPVMWSDLLIGPNGAATTLLTTQKDDFFAVDSWYGAALISGAISSFGIDQSLIQSSATGRVANYDADFPPQLRITYLV